MVISLVASCFIVALMVNHSMAQLVPIYSRMEVPYRCAIAHGPPGDVAGCIRFTRLIGCILSHLVHDTNDHDLIYDHAERIALDHTRLTTNPCLSRNMEDESCDVLRHWFFASLITTLMWWLVIGTCLLFVCKVTSKDGPNAYWSSPRPSATSSPETTEKEQDTSEVSTIITSTASTSAAPKGPWQPPFGTFVGKVLPHFPPSTIKTMS